MSEGTHGVDLTSIAIHLGPGGTARPYEDFSWERIDQYAAATAGDGPDGRLVVMYHSVGAWPTWEQHPVGEEVVIACTGTHHFRQEIDGEERVVTLGPGEALVNPKGVWHTADSGPEGGWLVFITPGQGTENRPIAGE